MKTRRFVSALGVTGLAVAAALVTGNLIHAADSAAKSPQVDGQAALTSTCAGFCFVTGGADLASFFSPFGRKLDLADGGRGPECDLIRTVNEVADGFSKNETEPGAVKPDDRVAAETVSIQAAAEGASNAADLDGLFDVVPAPRPVRLAAAKDAQGERGKKVYLKLCYVCHQPDGRGVPGVFPTLAQSDYMVADRSRAIRIVLHGLSGPITVNGRPSNGVMPALGTELADQQIADVLTYVFNAWENPGGAFTADQVEDVRNAQP